MMGSLAHTIVPLGYLGVAVAGVIAIFWFARHRPPPKWAIGFLVLGVAMFELVSFKITSPPNLFGDFFSAYYPAGQAALHHDPAMLRAVSGQGVLGFVNMPVVAYLFAPFAWLGPKAAIALFTLIGIGLTVAAWVLLVRFARLEVRERWLLALLFLTNGPLLNGVKLGNASYFILFALAGGIVLLREGRSIAAGALLGAAAIIKPPLILFGLFFMLRRDWRGVLGFAGVGAATAALSLVLFGWSDNLNWFETCIAPLSHTSFAAFNVQSFSAFLLRLRSGPASMIHWNPYFLTPGEALLAKLLSGLTFLVAAAACIRRAAPAPQQAEASLRLDLQYLLVVCLCLVSSPLTWSHYYVWLLVPTAFFLGSKPSFSQSRAARWLGWTAIFLVTPLVAWPASLSNPSLMAAYESVVVSHLLFGGLLWFGLIAWGLAATGGLLSRPAAQMTSANPKIGSLI